MARFEWITVFALSLWACSSTIHYTSRVKRVEKPVDPNSIDLLSTTDSREGYIEVGIIGSEGSSIHSIVENARTEAAKHGCDAIALNGGSVAHVGMEMSVSCLVVDEGTPKKKPKPKSAPTSSAPSTCRPECKDGFDCSFGECYPACNPPCEDGGVCRGHGTEAKCAP